VGEDFRRSNLTEIHMKEAKISDFKIP